MKIITLLSILLVFATSDIFANDLSTLTQDENNTISVFRESSKSVVFISSIRKMRRHFFDPNPIEVPAGAGTGFVWDDEGHIVTNYHVVQGSKKVSVTFHKDTKEYLGEVIGAEPLKDIAVIKLKTMPKKLTPVKVGKSKDLIVGQKTIAIGNPFGLDHTVTSGIISALGRKIDGIGGVKIHDVIQTDASINPGNSGGPLLNSRGEVIGMNTMIISPSGSSAGIGFAVPVDAVRRAVPQLIKYGEVIRPMIGIIPLPEQYKDYFGIRNGFVVQQLIKGSPAAKSGLRPIVRSRTGYKIGDIIIEVDGQKIDNFDDIFQVLDKKEFGDTIKLKAIRNRKVITVNIKLFKMKGN